jgi:CMP-N-acetylneuraminic acid synthetase|tara:strand:- start:5537 stop:6277 length:741 start_codon:yes stop_codon:yes gene_type:complete
MFTGGNIVKISALLLAKSKSSYKDKNILPIFDRPTMSYPMLAAKNTGLISSYYISSDSQKYLEIANDFGYQGILRPDYLSTDTAKSDDAVKHAFSEVSEIRDSEILIVQHANVVTIYPDLITEAIDILKKDESLTSVVPAHENLEYNPYRCFFLDEDRNLKPAMRDMSRVSPNRQDLPTPLFLDHSFWCIRTKNIGSNFNFSPWNALGDRVMPLVREGMFDIHNEDDVIRAKDWLTTNKQKVEYLW